MSKQKRRDPIKVMLTWTLILAVLAAGAFIGNRMLGEYRQNRLKDLQAEAIKLNEQEDQRYLAEQKALDDLINQPEAPKAEPTHATEGWDVVDMTGFSLKNASVVTMLRSDVMNNGMLLVNEWHSRPEDFSEAALVSIGNYSDGKLQVDNYNLRLFPVAIDAYRAAVEDAAAQGLSNYMVDGAYRSMDDQNALFQKALDRYKDRYKGDELIAKAKKSVNYPGTSEFNSGLSFTVRLYKSGDAAVTGSNYVETAEGKWMNENCWRYGLIFRFPKADYPLPGTLDKSYKTGVSVSLDAYRYVGKGHAAVMHHLNLCMEEYVEFLQEHPYIAVYEDGVLRYEIVRQYVGDDAASFNVTVTRNCKDYVTSMDNMGHVITVFEY